MPARVLATTAALAAVLLLTSCAGSLSPDDTTAPTQSSAPQSGEPAAEEPVASPMPGADPTCDTIITPGTVQALTDAGWTYEQRDFVIGDVHLDDGVLCLWADYTVASDHGQFYGWAPISAADASAAQASLLAAGWKREDDASGVYITENPDFLMGSEDGYGQTYLFGDGWVKFADSKQWLLLVTWPG